MNRTGNVLVFEANPRNMGSTVIYIENDKIEFFYYIKVLVYYILSNIIVEMIMFD